MGAAGTKPLGLRALGDRRRGSGAIATRTSGAFGRALGSRRTIASLRTIGTVRARRATGTVTARTVRPVGARRARPAIATVASIAAVTTIAIAAADEGRRHRRELALGSDDLERLVGRLLLGLRCVHGDD